MARQATFQRGNTCIVWEFPSATGGWEQSELVSAGQGYVFVSGRDPLINEEGRQILLEKYGLLEWADELPLARITVMSPDILAAFKEEHAPA